MPGSAAFQPFLEELEAAADPVRAEEMAAYHKAERRYLGLSNPQVNDMTKAWRQNLTVDQRIAVADGLWQTNIFEARLAAAKLLTQARIKPDDGVWRLIASWVPDFDSWAIADHACMAGQRRLLADPTRLDEVETWTRSDHMWTRRSSPCPGPSRTTQSPKTWRGVTGSLAGPPAMCPIATGSFRRPSPGGCANCPNMTRSVCVLFWRSTVQP